MRRPDQSLCRKEWPTNKVLVKLRLAGRPCQGLYEKRVPLLPDKALSKASEPNRNSKRLYVCVSLLSLLLCTAGGLQREYGTGPDFNKCIVTVHTTAGVSTPLLQPMPAQSVADVVEFLRPGGCRWGWRQALKGG